MSKSKKEINPECGKRLRTWLTLISMKQNTLAKIINISTVHLNNIITGKKNLTYEIACDISNQTSYMNNDGDNEKVLPEWLMCKSEYMTDSERINSNYKYHKKRENDLNQISACASALVDAAMKKCTLENIYDYQWTDDAMNMDSVQNDLELKYKVESYQNMEKDIVNNDNYPDIPENIKKTMCAIIESYAYNLVYSYFLNRKNDPLWQHVEKKK